MIGKGRTLFKVMRKNNDLEPGVAFPCGDAAPGRNEILHQQGTAPIGDDRNPGDNRQSTGTGEPYDTFQA